MLLENKFLGTAFAVGVAILATGCPATDDDSSVTPTPTGATPTATATVTPQPLYFDETYLGYDCTDQAWDFYMLVDGWTDPGTAQLGIFDYSTYCEAYGDPDTGDCYNEWHPVATAASSTDDGYYEELGVSLDFVATLAEQTDGASTIFQCDNEAVLTYAFCADDNFYLDNAACVFFGNEASFWQSHATDAPY